MAPEIVKKGENGSGKGKEGQNMGGSGNGSGQGTIFSADVSDLCVDQRSQCYEGCLPHGPAFGLLRRSCNRGCVSTISTSFCNVHIKLTLFFVDQHLMLV